MLASLLLTGSLTGCNKSSGANVSTIESKNSTMTATEVASAESSTGVEATEEGTFITKEYQFYSETEDGLKFEIPEEIEVNGKKYKYTGNAEYITSEIMSVVAQTVDVEVKDKDDVSKEYTYKSDSGKTYTLYGDIFNFSELVPIKTTVTERVEYSPRVSKPNITKTKEIEYYNEVSGKDEVISGTLVDSGKSSTEWYSGYSVNAVFTANHETVSDWTVEGNGTVVNVPQTSDTPTWSNYQNDVISLLGLDANFYRCTGAEWNGNAFTNVDGMLQRSATFHCDSLLTSYWAEYTGIGEAYGYKAKVTYYAYAESFEENAIDKKDVSTLYKMVAVASYKEV